MKHDRSLNMRLHFPIIYWKTLCFCRGGIPIKNSYVNLSLGRKLPLKNNGAPDTPATRADREYVRRLALTCSAPMCVTGAPEVIIVPIPIGCLFLASTPFPPIPGQMRHCTRCHLLLNTPCSTPFFLLS